MPFCQSSIAKKIRAAVVWTILLPAASIAQEFVRVMPPFLADPDNRFLYFVMEEQGNESRTADMVLSAARQLNFRKELFTRYENLRDFAIGTAAAGLLDQARENIEEAGKLAAGNPDRMVELRALGAFIELRFRNIERAREHADYVCANPSALSELSCLHLQGLLESVAGAATAKAKMRALREKSTINFPFDAFPREPQWDPIRVAHYDALRKLFGLVWDDRSSIALENRVRREFIDLFREGFESGKPKEVWGATKVLFDFEMVHNNVNGGAALLRQFRAYEEEKKWAPNPDAHGYLIQALLRAGYVKDARAELEKLIAREAKAAKTDAKRLRQLLAVGQILDVPENSDVARELFDRVWKAKGSSPEISSIRFTAGLKLLKIFALQGDLLAFEQHRAAVMSLAGKLEGGPFSQGDDTRLHTALVDLAVAEAIAKYDPRPERLVQARETLRGMFRRVRRIADLRAGKPDDVAGVLQRQRQQMSNAKRSERMLELAAASDIQILALPVMGRIEISLENWPEAHDLLLRAYHLEYEKHTVCGRPVQQSQIALDLMLISEQRNDWVASANWINEALACLGVVDDNSLTFAKALAERAKMLAREGNWYVAEFTLKRAIAIHRNLDLLRDRAQAQHRSQLAQLYKEGDDLGLALAEARSSTSILTEVDSQQWTAEDKAAVQRHVAVVTTAIKRNGSEPLEQEAFQLAQLLGSSQAAQALEAASHRVRQTDSRLGQLVQERDEFARQIELLSARLREIFGASGTGDNAASLNDLKRRLKELNTRVADHTRTIETAYSSYSSLARPEPSNPPALQQALREGEVLLHYFVAPDEVLAWAITARRTLFATIPVDAKLLGAEVAALRCGLDVSSWNDPASWARKTEAEKNLARAQEERLSLCRRITGVDRLVGDMPPFDIERANKLYNILFGPLGPVVSDGREDRRHLIIVPTGALASLPFQALVRRPPSKEALAGGSYAQQDWLGVSNPISVLPSVSTLITIRGLGSSSAKLPFIGFGNPILLGPSGTDESAKSHQNCAQASQLAASLQQDALRGAAADLRRVRNQAPLPETAYEICAIAQHLGVTGGHEQDAIWLGDRATESNVKALSRAGQLSKYSVVHFATHAVLASESEAVLGSRREPALLLTPPHTAPRGQDDDDGILSASEIALLNLDADWVVLSACNTAAGDQSDSEPLSGLARAFFYAKARALLVSYWYVHSETAVSLTTRAFSELANNGVGRAEALRRSIQVFVSSAKAEWTHPAYWAPFVLVGDGAK